MKETKYGFGTTLHGVSFDDAVRLVTEELKAEGFGVLTEIDVQATLKKKLNVDFRRYVILGACNPTLARTALEADSQLGLLLPCNVVVQESAPEGVEVSLASPEVMFSLVDKPEAAPVAKDAEARLRRVASRLQMNGDNSRS